MPKCQGKRSGESCTRVLDIDLPRSFSLECTPAEEYKSSCIAFRLRQNLIEQICHGAICNHCCCAVCKLIFRFGNIAMIWPTGLGQESWATLEREFQISASCSASGSVFFQVKFYGASGAAEEWQASAGIGFELGLLPGLAARARAFFVN